MKQMIKKILYFPPITMLVMLIMFLSRETVAIITKEDPQDAIINFSQAKFFVSLFERGDCAGVVISDSYIVTAAHCVCGTRNDGVQAIDYRNDKIEAVAAYRDPDRVFNCNNDGFKDDVALLQFEANTFSNHDPRSVYSSSDEAGKIIWIIGMGVMGQPDDFPTGRSCRNGPQDGNLREGYNQVETARNGVLTYRMDRSGSSSHGREAIAQDGDSGGPALIEQNGEWKVAGVNSGSNENNHCDWGSRDMYCRLSEHADWIDRAMDSNLNDSIRGLWYTWSTRPTTPPLQTPTPEPTPNPTSDSGPNPSPTPAPIITEMCIDSPLPMAVRNRNIDCEWVGGKTERRCRIPNVASHCPNTCKKCGAFRCKDSRRRFRFENGRKKCRFFKRNPERCDEDGVAGTCRDTCGYCTAGS